MLVKVNKGSLIHDYLYYSVIVVFTIIVLSATLAFFTFENIKEEREARYIHELNRICDELSESFKYLEKSAEYTADKITHLQDGDKEKIAYYLKKSTRFPRLKEDIFTWALFNFIDPDRYIIADSIKGVLSDPVKIQNDALWLKLSRVRPGELHFSEPDYGYVVGEETINTGYGVVKNSKFIGTISVGFNVNRLNQKINNILNNSGILFIIADDQYNIITQSNNQNLRNDILADRLRNEKIIDENSGELSRPIKYRGGFYTHFMRIKHSPYYIIVGDRKVDLKGAFLRDFMPQILQTFSLIFLFLTLLYFFRLKVINPIVSLSEAADKISRGEEDVEIPVTATIEMRNLATQLEKVMSYTKELRETQKNLIETQKSVEKALVEVEEAKKSKEIILSNLAYGLRVPAHRVLNHAEYLVGNIAEKNPKNPLIKGWKEVAHTARYIQMLILDLLEYTRSDNDKIMLHEGKVNIVNSISYTIDMVKMIASEKFIDINFKHGNNIPTILADDLRIKQILTNFITSAILKSPQNAIILVNCYFDENLVISIKDHRYTSEREEGDTEFNNPFISSEYNKDDAIMYSEEVARSLAELHGCKVEQIQSKDGLTIMIKFPKFRLTQK